MRIERVINNNVVSTVTEENIEYVLMGKGIGFQKKSGDVVEKSRIEKKFIIEKDDIASQLREVYVNIPSKEADAIYDIILKAEKQLNQSFGVNVYLALADHIHYAIERTKEGIEFSNPLAWEVKRFYKNEYAIGKEAIFIIEKYTGIQLNRDEAASIALHFVNAQKEGQLIEETLKITEIVRGILSIVQLHYGSPLDEESISYNRFLTHLQYFAQRIILGERTHSNNDDFFLEQIKQSYPEAYRCTQRIVKYVEKTYHTSVESDEEIYLTVHTERVMNKKVNNA